MHKWIPKEPSTSRGTWGLLPGGSHFYGKSRIDASLCSQDGHLPPPSLSDRASGVTHLELFGSSLSFKQVGALSITAGIIILAIGVTNFQALFVAGFFAVIAFTIGAFSIREHLKNQEAEEQGPLVYDEANQGHREFIAGINNHISSLMNEVATAATGYSDPIWGLYEQVVELADESAGMAETRQASFYDDAIAEQAAQIRGVIADRQTQEARNLSDALHAQRRAEREVEELSQYHLRDSDQALQDRLNALTQSVKSFRKDLDQGS